MNLSKIGIVLFLVLAVAGLSISTVSSQIIPVDQPNTKYYVNAGTGDTLNPQLYGYDGVNNTFLAFDKSGLFEKILTNNGIFFKAVKPGHITIIDNDAVYVFSIYGTVN